MARVITLVSPLDPTALATRFKAIVPDAITHDTPPGVIGRGDETRMTLWFHRALSNSFHVTLVADVTAHGAGSRIAGRIGAPRAATAFLGCWFAFVATFLVSGLAIGIVLRPPIAFIAPFTLIPLGMLGIGGLVAWLGFRHHRHDERAIIDFLSRTVEAHPI